MTRIAIDEAGTRLRELIATLQPGEELQITDGDQAIARRVAEPTGRRKPRQPGGAVGKGRRGDWGVSHIRCGFSSALLIVMALAGIARADSPARVKASWKEKDARVEVFSADGGHLVSSGGEGYQLRDAGTGKVLAVLAAKPHQIHGAMFSPDKRFLFAKVHSDRHKPVGVFDLVVWTVATGKVFATFAYISEGINIYTEDFGLSADGKTLAFIDNSERVPMKVETGKMAFNGLKEVTIAFNVSKGLPRVKIWDVLAWKERATVAGGSPLVFSPDGTTLVTGARDWQDPTARVWDAATGRPRAELDSGAPWMKPLTFSPDGKYLAIGTSRKQELYELASGRRWSVAAPVNLDGAPAFSADGRLLFPSGLPRIDPSVQGGAGPYDCYNLATLPPKRLELRSAELVISPDGRRYASLRGERYTGGSIVVALHDLPSLREIGQVEADGLAGAGFSPDGRWLALLVGRNEVLPSGSDTRYVQEIRLIDPATARVMRTIPSPGQTWGNHGWKFSPDGKSLAVYYRTGSNVRGPGDPDPSDRPMTVEIWEVPPR